MLLKLLFSVNCRTTTSYRAIRSLHFHHLWDRHIVNYIIPLHMWVHHTVRIVGPRHLGFPVPVGLPPSSLCNRRVDISVDRRFKSYQNPNIFKNWHSCSYQSYQKSGKHYASRFLKLPSSCQQWELTFLSIVAFRATKISTTLRADSSCQSYLTPGRHYASSQLSALTT